MIWFLEFLLWAFRFAAGACIFSFLNVVIYRLPRGESVVKGRSHCTKCGHELTAFELIPLVSFLCLGGKCKACKAPISARYFVIECIGGAAFALCSAFYGIGATGLISLKGALAFAFLAVLMAMAMIDWDTRTIYDRFHVIILLLGIVSVWLDPQIGIASRLIGAVELSVPMLLLALIIPGAFGGGDIKLMAASGWLLGWKANLFAGFAGLLAGGVYCIVMLATKKIGRKDHFAFGPFLALGLALAMFVGDAVMDWYLGCLW